MWMGCLFAISAMAQTQTITVGRGETFELIAKRYGMTVEELKKMNPAAIDGVVGMKLKVKTVAASKVVSASSQTIKAPSATAKKTTNEEKTNTIQSEDETLDRIFRKVELSEKAIGYMQEKKYSKAIKVYDQLFEEFPNGEWFMRKGFVLYLDGKYKSAIGQYEKALSRNDMDDNLTASCKEYLAKAKQLQAEKVERRKAAWANVGAALAVGAAIAGTAYVASQSSSGSSYTSNSNYSPYSTSNATSQFNSRSDQILANANAQMQQIGEATLRQAAQQKQRIEYVMQQRVKWAGEFNNKNGRYPTDAEQKQWLHDNYYDIWQLEIQGEANRASSNSSSANSENTKTSKSSSSQTHTFKCSYCNGSGRVLFDDDGGVPHFGLEKKVKGRCSECGATTYEGYPHKHMNCTHCKGTGTKTY